MAGSSLMKSLPGSTTDLGQSQLDSPDLTLIAESIFANELQLSISIPALTNCSQTWAEQALAQWPWVTYRRADSKGRRGTLYVLEYDRGAMVVVDERICVSEEVLCPCQKSWCALARFGLGAFYVQS